MLWYREEGYTIFGIMFFVFTGFILLLSYMLAVLFSSINIKSFIFHLLSIAGSLVLLYYSAKIKKVLKNTEVDKFLSEIGFLLWFYVFELFSMLVVIIAMMFSTVIEFKPELFETHKVFCMWLMISTCFLAGMTRGIHGFVNGVKQKFVEGKKDDRENMETR